MFVYDLSYGYDWKIEEAQKNLMRTHTTAVSARMLYKIAQQVGVMLIRCQWAHTKSVQNRAVVTGSVGLTSMRELYTLTLSSS